MPCTLACFLRPDVAHGLPACIAATHGWQQQYILHVAAPTDACSTPTPLLQGCRRSNLEALHRLWQLAYLSCPARQKPNLSVLCGSLCRLSSIHPCRLCRNKFRRVACLRSGTSSPTRVGAMWERAGGTTLAPILARRPHRRFVPARPRLPVHAPLAVLRMLGSATSCGLVCPWAPSAGERLVCADDGRRAATACRCFCTPSPGMQHTCRAPRIPRQSTWPVSLPIGGH